MYTYLLYVFGNVLGGVSRPLVIQFICTNIVFFIFLKIYNIRNLFLYRIVMSWMLLFCMRCRSTSWRHLCRYSSSTLVFLINSFHNRPFPLILCNETPLIRSCQKNNDICSSTGDNWYLKMLMSLIVMTVNRKYYPLIITKCLKYFSYI